MPADRLKQLEERTRYDPDQVEGRVFEQLKPERADEERNGLVVVTHEQREGTEAVGQLVASRRISRM